jgi:hypothetical protein
MARKTTTRSSNRPTQHIAGTPSNRAGTVRALAVVGLLMVGLGAGVYALATHEVAPKTTHVQAVVLDPSLTVPPAERCENLVRIADEHFSSAGDSRLALFAMGESDQGNVEHVATLVREKAAVRLELHVQDEVHEGVGLNPLLDEVHVLCMELETTMESPIYEAVGATLDMMDAAGCGSDPNLVCRLAYIGDAMEDRHPEMTARVKGKDVEVLPLSNRAVPVTLCGTMDRTVRGPSQQALKEAWRPAFLVEPVVLAECLAL